MTKSTEPPTGNSGIVRDTEATVRAMRGNAWSPAFERTSWPLSGTVLFLQQSSDCAVGAHLPFKQQSITSEFGLTLAKQSKGLTSSTTASKLMTT